MERPASGSRPSRWLTPWLAGTALGVAGIYVPFIWYILSPLRLLSAPLEYEWTGAWGIFCLAASASALVLPKWGKFGLSLVASLLYALLGLLAISLPGI